MGARVYDITLPCGCMLSLDKGGGMIPCSAGYDIDISPSTKEEKELHEKSWREYNASDRAKEDREEIERRNS